MYGSYRNSGIWRMKTYEAALDFYNNVTPIRGSGRNAGVKPLGHRNRPWFQITKDSDDVVKCRLYDTDVVTFYPNGNIRIKSEGWSSQTTANFIYDVLGIGTCIYDHSLVVSVFTNIDGRLTNGSFRVGTKDIMLVPAVSEIGVKYYNVESEEKYYVYHINRKKMNELRKSAKEFRTYLEGTTKLRDGMFEADELGLGDSGDADMRRGEWALSATKYQTPNPKTYAAFAESVRKSGDDGNWHKASIQLAYLNNSWYTPTKVRRPVVTMLNNLNKVLMFTDPSVFIKTEVPYGDVKRNRYSMYEKVNKAWEASNENNNSR